MQRLEFNSGVISGVQCYKEAWEMIKGQYWTVFAVVIVGMLVASIIPLIILGPMMCGIYLCLFDLYDGQQINFEKLFKGFDLFVPSLVLSVIIMGPIFVMILLMYIPMIGMAMAGPRMSESELMAFILGVVGVELVFALIMVCIHTLVIFSFPILVDKRVSAWQSITLSARAVWANLSGVVGLFAVGFVVVLVGYLMLCIGLYLVMPLIMAANVVAYRKVFPGRVADPFSTPPPPSAYLGI